MYIDADTDCNNLNFNFAQTAVGIANLATRSITIKALQLGCGNTNLAPAGCAQYFFGTGGASTIKSFGYDGTTNHLVNQHQTICVRRESGKLLHVQEDLTLRGFTLRFSYFTRGTLKYFTLHIFVPFSSLGTDFDTTFIEKTLFLHKSLLKLYFHNSNYFSTISKVPICFTLHKFWELLENSFFTFYCTSSIKN